MGIVESGADHSAPSTTDEPAHKVEPNGTSTSKLSSCSEAWEITPLELSTSHLSTRLDADRHSIALSRIRTERSQHKATVGLSSTNTENHDLEPLPGFGAGKPYPLPPLDQDAYIVEFDGASDPLHAMNWPLRKKILTSLILGFTTFTVAFNSALFSTATAAVAKEFDVSSEVGVLGVSLYVLRFAAGPIFWAPFSELKGRRIPIVVSMLGFSIFQVGVAAGKDLQTVLLCRFWGGMFGASPMAIVAAIFSDMYDDRTRGLAITVFSMNVLTAPLLAPFVGGFITESYLGRRWTAWLASIMGFAAFGLDLVFFKETYAPAILVSKAARLRRRTKVWAIHAKQEEIEINLRELLTKNFSRPLMLLFTEPLILLVSIYLSSFIYGLLYLFLTAYPIVFQEIHGMSQGVGGLPYLAMVIGMLLAGIYVILTQPSYQRKLAANNGVVIPEWRLPPAIVGGITFAAGVFWFGWAGYKSSTPWIVPALSGLLTGFGLLATFLQCLNYLVDAYLIFAASANAGSTMLRSIFGACFPLFAKTMFDKLGVNWSGTLLGFIAAACIPIPVIFYVYGHRIRARSSFTSANKPIVSAAGVADEESRGSESKVE